MGELTDLMASLLLERGFSLISRIRDLPHLVDGWTVTHRSGGNATDMQITAPDGTILYVGSAYPPPDWRMLTDHGWCLVYAASGRLAGQPGETELELRVAAHRVELVGARVAIVWE